MPAKPFDPNALLAAGPVKPEEAATKRTGDFAPISTPAVTTPSDYTSSGVPSIPDRIDDSIPTSPEATKKANEESIGSIADKFNALKRKADTGFDEGLNKEEAAAKEREANEKKDKATDAEVDGLLAGAEAGQVSQTTPEGKAGDAASGEQAKPPADPKLPLTARQPSSVPPTAQPTGGYSEEDLKALDPELPALVKKMSKEAVGFTVARLKQNKELLAKKEAEVAQVREQLAKAGRGELPQQWYEHEEAYQISPEFKQADHNYQYFGGLQQHYQAQLEKVRAGEPTWVDLVSDGKGGFSAVEKKLDATNAAKVDVLLSQRLLLAQQAVNQAQQQAMQIQQNFKVKSTEARQYYKQIENTYFPQYADENVAATNPHIKTIMETFRQGGRDHPIIPFVAKMYATVDELQRAVEERDAELAKYRGKVAPGSVPSQVAKKVGPSSADLNSGGAATTKPTDPNQVPFDPNLFKKYKNG